jgi:hypothetical protein
MRRECVGPLAWQDICGYPNYHDPTQTNYDNKPGNCPVGTTCLDGVNVQGRPFISCISTSNDQSKGKRKLDPQAETSAPQRGRTELGNTQLKFSVTLDHDMTGVAVAAVLQSEYPTVMFTVVCFFAHVGNQLF